MAQVSSVFHRQDGEIDNHLSVASTVGNGLNRAGVSVSALTSREASVLALIIQGSTNRETAKVLGISPRTVEFHRANIMQKTAAKNLADLMRLLFSGTIDLT
ncbi:MAG: helix-turn-helix transcriptional regulator [Devosia nanyangense]|uniref:Helix-turn-helix transcriptional regulator n=1 Tax=Devosia nanyangense TaxID=1228055 RepID=A0A933L6N6_9HYPH|nr:helix-turn-helix transcriptional regulator [Devosia nanyangense]